MKKPSVMGVPSTEELLSGTKWIALILVAVTWCTAETSVAQHLATVEPRGDGEIGYTTFTLESGLDELTPQEGDRRRLLVEIWYPASSAGSVRKPWATDSMGAALSRRFPFPEGFHNNIATHAWLDASPSEAPVPTIIFSPGLSFPPVLYQSIFEDMASRGYAVLAISHPHGAIMIEYPDGTTLDMSLWPQIEDEVASQLMLAAAADTWASDVQAVLDAMTRKELPVRVTTDASSVGLVGHSLGGTAVGKLTHEARVAGVVVMEGVVREIEDERGLGSLQVGTPLLHMIGGYNRAELELDSYRPGPDAPVFTSIINGTGHAYFSDLIHFYRAYADQDWHERHRYETEADRVLRISTDYISAFFDWRMKGAARSMLLRRPSYMDRIDGPQRGGYPEVDLSIALF